jgi:hypothetical protein
MGGIDNHLLLSSLSFWRFSSLFSLSPPSSFSLPLFLKASYRLSQFAALDVEINKLTDALRDVAFPTINKEALHSLVTNKKYPNKLKDLEHCRMSLEQWVYYVISRIDILPVDLRNVVENFFMLPNGPHYSGDEATPSSTTTSSKPGDYKSPTLADLNSIDGQQSDVWDDEMSETRTEWTVGSLDENGKPKKKKKRIIKGIKKRVSNILGTNSSRPKEGFGVDFSGVDGELPPGPPVATKSMVSGVSSVGSDHGRPSMASSAGVQQVQPAKLLKVRVSRGGEKSRGHHEYEVLCPSLPSLPSLPLLVLTPPPGPPPPSDPPPLQRRQEALHRQSCLR